MNLYSKTLLSGAAAAALAFAVSAQAAVVVDLFVDPIGGQIVDTSPDTGGITPYSQVGTYPSIIGGYRDLGITQLPDADALQYSRATVIGGSLSVANDPSVKSRTVVTWDGANTAGVDGSAVDSGGLSDGVGGPGYDLTAGGASFFQALVKYADLGFNYSIKVWDVDGDWATLSAAVQFGVAAGNLDVATYLYDWFNLGAGTYCDGVSAPPGCTDPLTQLDFEIFRSGPAGNIDFTRVGALQLVLENPSVASVDFILGSIQTVPEPSALALTGLALLGAGVAGRRRKTAKV